MRDYRHRRAVAVECVAPWQAMCHEHSMNSMNSHAWCGALNKAVSHVLARAIGCAGLRAVAGRAAWARMVRGWEARSS